MKKRQNFYFIVMSSSGNQLYLKIGKTFSKMMLFWCCKTTKIFQWSLLFDILQTRSKFRCVTSFSLSACFASLGFFSYNTSHKFLDQSPSPHYQCCLQVLSIWVSWHKLQSCYSSNMLQHWVGGRGLIYFCKVDHSRIFAIFSRNWLGLNNLYDKKNIVIDNNFSQLEGCCLKDQVKIFIIWSNSVQNIYLLNLLYCEILTNKLIRGQNTSFLMNC